MRVWNRIAPATIGIALMLLMAGTTVRNAGAQPPPPPPPLTPLPPPPQPPGNQVTTAKANLGKALFWDEQLSSTRTMACGTCHQPRRGGSDARSTPGSVRSTNPGPDGVQGTADDIVGSPGVVLNQPDGTMMWAAHFGVQEQVTGRLAPSHVNAAYGPQLFWDGRAGQSFADPDNGTVILPNGGALENQVLGPPLSTGEMGHIGRDWADAAARIASSSPLALAFTVPSELAAWIGGRDYPQLFSEAFGSASVTGARIAMAIASYERTLFSTQAPFDSVIAGTATLTPQEAAGMQLFGGPAGCARCHGGALMSDNQFHYIGVRPAAEDSGRAIVTHALVDVGAMKTPSLRNVALRPSFFHDGRFRTLAEVVDFYNRGGDFNAPNKDPRIVPLGLNDQQKAQLVAFLNRPLIDPRVAQETSPFDRPTLSSESGRMPEILAGGSNGSAAFTPQPVAFEPPMLGNPRFTVGLFDALGSAEATLVIDAAEPPVGPVVPAGGSLAHRTITLQGSGAGAGYGSVTLAIPNDPALLGKTVYGRWYVTDPGAAGGVASSPAFRMQLFGPRGSEGAVTVDPPALTTLRLSASRPSPFRTSTLVTYEVPVTSSVRLDVYDLAGRVVRRLDERRNAAPGTYTARWDGTDDRGHAVAGGVYFYRLDTGRESRTTRVIRLP